MFTFHSGGAESKNYLLLFHCSYCYLFTSVKAVVSRGKECRKPTVFHSCSIKLFFIPTVFTVCGGKLYATNRVKHFYSHARYGDFNYENDLICEWTIEAEYGSNVHLTFLTFEVEDERDCNYDYVVVHGGTDNVLPYYGKFCGNTVSIYHLRTDYYFG